MNIIKPLQAGDLAEVISGMLGNKSPNKGLIVKVIHRDYECQQLGKAKWTIKN